MYHVISKTANNDNQRSVLSGNIANRDEARAQAKTLDGTVKTDAELEVMVKNGGIATNPFPQSNQENQQVSTDQQPQGNPEPDAGNVQPPKSIIGAAEEVANQANAKTTVGKKTKPEPKRVETAAPVLEVANAYIDNDLMPKMKAGTLSKVDFVREMSGKQFNGSKLQRRDLLAMVAARPELSISPATVSTQFQFARSDRMTEHAAKAEKRKNEADKRAKEKAEKEQKKAADKQAKADKKAAEEKAKADKKAADEAAKQQPQEPAGNTGGEEQPQA